MHWYENLGDYPGRAFHNRLNHSAPGDSLKTTRRRALERPLNRIEDLRRSRGISLPEDEALAEPASLYQPFLESLDSGANEQ